MMLNIATEIKLRRLLAPMTVFVLVGGLAGCSTFDRLRGVDRDQDAATASTAPAREPAQPAVAQADVDAEPAEAPPETYIRRGTGVLINPAAIAQPQVSSSPDGETAVNFRNAPIADVVQAILGDILGLAYAIDPSVQGTVSLQTSSGLPRSALLPVLEQALRLNGLAMYRADGFYQIAPVEAVTQDIGMAPTLAIPGRDTPGFGISIVPMKYVGVGQLQRLVQPFTPASVTIQTDTERNIMLVAGPGQARTNVIDLLMTFDIDWMSGMSLAMFPLDAADAASVVEELQAIFAGDGDGAGGGEDVAPGVVRFVPVERLNSILAITPNPDYLNLVEDWLTRLDRGQGEANGRTLKVYRIQNGRATDVATVLGELFGAERSVERETGAAPLAPGLQPMTLSTDSAMDQGAARVERLEPRETAIAGFSRGEEGLRVIADDTNNALVVLGTESEHRLIRSALRDLDIPPLQVLIEATIAEVTLDDQLRFGLQWFFSSGNSDFTLSNSETGAVSPMFPGFSYVLDNSDDVRLVIDALDDITDLRVISSPQLMVLNNQSALLQVGDQVPVAIRSAQSVQNPDSPIVNTIEFKDTGVILRVTPRVNSGGLVLLDIEQEVSTVVNTTTSGIDSPTIQQRRIASTVAVQSGETVALGGLIRDSVQQGESGIPYLSRIPLLGNLFKTTNDISTRTELLVLLTPRVVSDIDEARDVTLELRDRLSLFGGMDIDAKVIDPNSKD